MVLLKKEQEGLEIARQYIDSHYSKTIKVQELVHISGIYEAKLYKAFKWKYHQTIYQYQLSLRMAKARELLMTELSAKAVAVEVGYFKSSRFWHMFKKHFGVSPNTYKKMYCTDLPVVI